MTAPLVDEEMELDDAVAHSSDNSHIANPHHASLDLEIDPEPTETTSGFHDDLRSPMIPEVNIGLAESTRNHIFNSKTNSNVLSATFNHLLTSKQDTHQIVHFYH